MESGRSGPSGTGGKISGPGTELNRKQQLLIRAAILGLFFPEFSLMSQKKIFTQMRPVFLTKLK